MQITHTIQETREKIKAWKKDGRSVGLVPTMGYLHEGHQSLMQISCAQNDKTVVSIFVNPMQFSASEDFGAYPRDLQADARLCERAGVDLIFCPDAEEMYGKDFYTFVDMENLTTKLCGTSRPAHFRGVCTVVSKLLHIVTPDRAYFGQKDAQQLLVIKKMVKDLNIDVEIVGCPIIREADGLAKSSRNVYLSREERRAARVLSQAVFEGERLVKTGERHTETVIRLMRDIIEAEPLATIDYIEIVASDSMAKLQTIEGPVLVAVAVLIGKTRLIDNFVFHVSKHTDI